MATSSYPCSFQPSRRRSKAGASFIPSSSACSVKTWSRGSPRALEERVGHVGLGHAVQPDQLVQGGQRGGQLRAGDDLRVVHRHEGVRAARSPSSSRTRSAACAARRARSSASRPRRAPAAPRRRRRGSAGARAPSGSRSRPRRRRRRRPATSRGPRCGCRPRSPRRARRAGWSRSACRCPGRAAASRRAACAGRSARGRRCAPPCRGSRGGSTRVMARPVWSGPRLKRNVAPAPCFFSISTRRGTPSRVPR